MLKEYRIGRQSFNNPGAAIDHKNKKNLKSRIQVWEYDGEWEFINYID